MCLSFGAYLIRLLSAESSSSRFLFQRFGTNPTESKYSINFQDGRRLLSDQGRTPEAGI